MHYLTRHLEALRDLPFGDSLVTTGRRFYATEVDADYLVGSKQAQELVDESAAADVHPVKWAPLGVSAVAAAVTEVLPPAAAPSAPAAVEPAVDAAPAAEPAADAQPEPTPNLAADEVAIAAAAPESRRRGRPTNAEKLARQSAEAGGADLQAASAP